MEEGAQAWSATARELFEIASDYGDANDDERIAEVVVRELVSNGIRALDTQFFSKKKRRQLKVRVSLRRRPEGDVWVSVKDTGCGMTRGDLTNRLAAPGVTSEQDWRQALAQRDALALAFGENALGMGVSVVFAVADAFRVASKHDDDDLYSLEAWRGRPDFVVKQLSRDDDGQGELTGRGTVVSFRCKPGRWSHAIDEALLRRTVAALADASSYPVTVLDGDENDQNQNQKDDDDDDQGEEDVMADEEDEMLTGEQPTEKKSSSSESFAERAKYVPLRLSYQERKYLRLVEAALKVAGYVDRVDAATTAAKPPRRQMLQLQGVAGVLTGLVTAVDPERGAQLATERDFASEAKFLRRCFEIARRYKILNPERMRTEYGQLVYLLQDAAMPDIQEDLGFALNAPVRTVYAFLRDRNGLSLLEDPLVYDATREILPDPSKTRAQIQHLIKRKERAVKTLARNYGYDRLSADDVELCLCSICDNESYLNSARLPIDQTLALLRTYFDATSPVGARAPTTTEDDDDDLEEDDDDEDERMGGVPPRRGSSGMSEAPPLSARSRSDRADNDDDVFASSAAAASSSSRNNHLTTTTQQQQRRKKKGTSLAAAKEPPPVKKNASSLAISDADGSGARLSHSHARQFRFAEQSLSLWRAIVNDMFRLWSLAEADLLSGDAPYALRDTGQGLQRVQACPRTYAAMVRILGAERERSAWVGSAMVHMGDHNVPNALTFLDKYAQVARILRPLITVLNRVKVLAAEDRHVRDLVRRGFGSTRDFEQLVLADFFRHAFDGSGADNFYDAGSCVDGRLTSAWNWCNNVPTKPYFVLFKLTGFNGFDGEFA